jgi:predicted dienelactone hydrolase
LGPNPSLGSNVILQRSKDVSFTIDEMLQGGVDQKTHIAFSRAVDSQSIGVLGYSLGGETTLATVTGISSANYPADRRVKAASDLKHLKQTDFSRLRGSRPAFLPFANDAAIYEQFQAGTGASCAKGDDEDDSR